MRDRLLARIMSLIAGIALTLSVASPVHAADDVTPPTAVSFTPAVPVVLGLGSFFRLNAVVLADYACADEVGGSGLASCTGTVPDGSPLETSTLGPHFFSVHAEDNAGNQTTITFPYLVVAPTKVSISSATLVENDSGKQAVKLAVQAEGNVPFAIGYHTEAGTADESDYTARSKTLSFYKIVTNKGGSSAKLKPKQVIVVPLKPDTTVEGDESFSVVLHANALDPMLPVDVVDDTGTVTILDDDPTPGPRVSVSDVSAREGSSMFFVVALSSPAPSTITVPYSVVGDTAIGGKKTLVGGDFIKKGPGTIRFNAGQRFKYIVVKTRDDDAVEGDETLHVELGTPTGASLYRATGAGTIRDGD